MIKIIFRALFVVIAIYIAEMSVYGQKKNPDNFLQTGFEEKDNYKSDSLFQELDKNGFGLLLPTDSIEVPFYDEMELWATQYYIHEAKYANNGIILKDLDENPTGAKIDLCDWCGAAVEGTIYTTDSIGNQLILNYGGKSKTEQVDCSKCGKYLNYKNKGIRYTLWYKAKGKYGDGVKDYKLVPYRTIAVDTTLIPIGTVIYIPEAKGKEIALPDRSKSIHDGYFFAADIGGDIKKNHIDVFTGLNHSNVFDFIESNPQKTFHAFKVKDKFVEEYLRNLHK